MGKPAASISVRIQKLEASLVRARALKRSITLDAKPMADLLGVNWVTLRDWCDTIAELETSQAVKRGGNGIRWEFSPRHTVEILIKHHRAILRGQERRVKEISDSTGVEIKQAASTQEARERVQLTVTVETYKEKQRAYMPRPEVLDFVARYNQEVVEGIMGVSTRVNPNGNIPPEIMVYVDEYLRAVAVSVHARAAKFIEEESADIQRIGDN